MSQASITPFAAVAIPARAPATHIPNTLSALDDVQQELDDCCSFSIVPTGPTRT